MVNTVVFFRVEEIKLQNVFQTCLPPPSRLRVFNPEHSELNTYSIREKLKTDAIFLFNIFITQHRGESNVYWTVHHCNS